MAILKRLSEISDEVKNDMARFHSNPNDIEVSHEPPAQAVPPPEARPVLKKTSRKWWLMEWLRRIFMGSAVGTASFASLDNINATRSYLDAITGFINSYGVFVLAFACLAGYAITYFVKEYMVEDMESGRYIPSGDNIDD